MKLIIIYIKLLRKVLTKSIYIFAHKISKILGYIKEYKILPNNIE